MIPETKLKSLELQNTYPNLKSKFNNNFFNLDNNQEKIFSQSFQSLIGNFEGLEAIITRIRIIDFTEQDNKDFADALQKNQETLKIFILQLREELFSSGLGFYPGLINAIIKCNKIFQLCLEIDSTYFLEEIT